MSMALEKEIIRLQRELASERAEHAETEGKLIDYKHLAEHANTKRDLAARGLAHMLAQEALAAVREELKVGNRLYAQQCDKLRDLESQLAAERAARKRDNDCLLRKLDVQFTTREQAEEKVERLRNFINRFARHDDGDVDGTEECREYRDGPDTCDCGYSKALEQALSAAPPPAAKETP